MTPYIADIEAERVHLVVSLSWPNKWLNPNSRLHPKAKHAVTKKARADAHLVTLEAAGYSLGTIRASLAGDDPIPLHVSFCPPDKRHRDLDNAIASAKALFDGLADALHVNDRRFAPEYRWGEPEKPGRVEVVVG